MKKEAYRNNLPHFQQPGHAYFVTWIVKDAVPPRALNSYKNRLQQLKSQIHFYKQNEKEKIRFENLRKEYDLTRKKYIKAFDDLLAVSNNNSIDLSHSENTKIIASAFHFWHDVKLKNTAFSIMPNHVHWVLELLYEDANGRAVYLQDILQSVKRFTARQINKREDRLGNLWQKESFETTIRDEKHLYHAVEYTLENPVNAGLVKSWKDWPGNFLSEYWDW